MVVKLKEFNTSWQLLKKQYCPLKGHQETYKAALHACSVASVVSDSWGPHGESPTRLLRPWDSPGKNVEWGAMPRGSFPSRDRTHISCISCIGGGFFTCQAIGEAQGLLYVIKETEGQHLMTKESWQSYTRGHSRPQQYCPISQDFQIGH